MDFDAPAGAAGDVARTRQPLPFVRPRTNSTDGLNWVTNPGARFINSLCPNSQAFPRLRGMTEEQRVRAESACKRAFYAVKDHVELQHFRFGELTKAELGVLMTIERKTLPFNKLFEKLPRRHFWQGEIVRDGSGAYRQNDFGNPSLPASVRDESTLTKGVEGLLLKGWISKSTADEGPGGHSSVYSALPVSELLDRFVTAMLIHLPVHEDWVDLFLDSIAAYTEALEQDANRHIEHAMRTYQRREQRRQATTA